MVLYYVEAVLAATHQWLPPTCVIIIPAVLCSVETREW